MSGRSLVVMYRDDDQEHEVTVSTNSGYATDALFAKAENIILDLIRYNRG